MTKLMEWLTVFLPLFSVWYLLVTKKIAKDFANDNELLIFYSPIIAVLLFGMYAASVVLYRVFTFNDCEDAAKELHKIHFFLAVLYTFCLFEACRQLYRNRVKKEIQEAREDLTKLGFVFKNSN